MDRVLQCFPMPRPILLRTPFQILRQQEAEHLCWSPAIPYSLM